MRRDLPAIAIMILCLAGFYSAAPNIFFWTATITASWIALASLVRTAKKIFQSEFLENADNFLTFRHQMTTKNLPSDLYQRNIDVITKILGPGENLDDRMAQTLGIDRNQNRAAFSNLLRKRILYVHKQKSGILETRYFESHPVTVDEILTPIAPQEYDAFLQFCLNTQ